MTEKEEVPIPPVGRKELQKALGSNYWVTQLSKEDEMAKVKFEQIGALGVITLTDSPMNLLGNELIKDLSDAVERAGECHLRGLILKVDEGSFSAGADVNIFLGMSPEAARERFTKFHALLHTIEAFPFPTMAAVKGFCFAGGLEVALTFDLIWAAENAAFGQVEVTIGALTFGGRRPAAGGSRRS